MDKDNGKGAENNSVSNKITNPPLLPPSSSTTTPTTTTSSSDPTSLLDAANLFGGYWPRGDATTNAANLFAAASGFGLPTHSTLPFGMLPPPTTGRGLPPGYPTATTTTAAAAAAAYSNAYTNTLSVAASQAASLGLPAASAAWWSMASHLAAQDYLARLQASGLNFPSLTNPSDLQYASLGLTQQLTTAAAAAAAAASAGGSHHKSKNTKHNNSLTSSSSLPKNRDKSSPSSSPAKFDGRFEQQSLKSSTTTTSSTTTLSSSVVSNNKLSSTKYSTSNNQGLVIQPAQSGMKLPNNNNNNNIDKTKLTQKINDLNANKQQQQTLDNNNKIKTVNSSSVKESSQSPSPSIFTSPLTLASNFDKNSAVNDNNLVGNLPTNSILSDPNSILGGVRLPPDTEIIKYTSSIVGPKIPGTTNRGRKKTISLDPPSVSVHPSHSSTGMLIERGTKRPKLNDQQDVSSSPPITSNDRVEVIKLPATNGSPLSFNSHNESNGGEAPLNLSLKPSISPSLSIGTTTTTPGASSSLNSLSNMSANLGVDRISRRKPGPKPRRVLPTGSQLPPASASLAQLFATADSPRPPSRNNSENSDGSSSISSLTTTITTTVTTTITTTTTTPTLSSYTITNHNNKEGRPRNLGRGVSKPKKNTVASLLAQSRALGIKPMPILDPNITINQQMNLLKSNILAAQQYINEAGGDEKALNKFLQEKFRGTLSDSSTIDASTDSDNLTDSNHTDSELEIEIANKKQKQYDERALRIPLEKGWKRETIIRGLTKSGGIKGDVTYAAPDSANKFKQMSDVTQYLEYQKSTDLTRENFTFSCRVIVGDYLQPVPPEMIPEAGEFIHLSEDDVTRRLEELKTAMRTNIPVEQRIEMARKQQAARAAARLDRESARLAKEIERSERQEAARRDREVRSQQLLEAKRKRQEELERHKQEEQQRKQQEREYKRQQAAILKEQERERRRQHMALVKALENRRKLEERERKKQQLLAEKQANKEKKLEQRKIELEILNELRKPCEDLELDQKPLPELQRINGLKLSGKAFGDLLMVFEFLHNFGETLGFDMESLPTLDSLQQALLSNEHSIEAEDELYSVMTHLLVCAIEDPGIPNPARHTTILGQSLRQADITHTNLSEILRIYLYANATGEVKLLTGVHFERDREKRIADHHQNDSEMQQTQIGKNSQYYELLHENRTWKLSDMLKDKPFLALSPTIKAEILAFICNELLQNKAVIRQIENTLENVSQQRKEKWLLDTKIRKLKMLHSRKVRSEAVEKAAQTPKSETTDTSENVDSPSLHKDDLLDDDENEMSENESVCTQPEEEEDNKLSGEELGKKLEKLIKQSELQLQTLNMATGQLRATCYGQDRYWRRYWSFSKAGGIFVEAIESAEPDVLNEQIDMDQRSLNEIDKIIDNVIDNTNDKQIDNEVYNIVNGDNDDDDDDDDDIVDDDIDNKENENNLQTTTVNNEHRKTPNRLKKEPEDEVVDDIDKENCNMDESREILDQKERNLAELRKSVDDIVQNINKENNNNNNNNQLEESQENLNNHICNNNNNNNNNDDDDGNNNNNNNDNSSSEKNESIGSKKFNLFEKLGQCMERENRTEEDLKGDVKAEIKEELKNEILSELKTEIKTEPTTTTTTPTIKTEDDIKIEQNEQKWFSILNKDSTCDGVYLTAGNRWDTGSVGACIRDNLPELKIPVFPPPHSNNNNNNNNSSSCSHITNNNNNNNNANNGNVNYHNLCDSPAPLQMTHEESVQLEQIKKHGMPKPCPKKPVPCNKRYGWWRIIKIDQLKELLDNLHVRGVREKELKRNFINIMQQMYDEPNKLYIEDGQKDLIELSLDGIDNIQFIDNGAPYPDIPGIWSKTIAHRVDLFLLEQVEALEDKVASASMQVKGWKIPNRDIIELEPNQVVPIAREHLKSLEINIERRYLKPPLGVNTGDANLVAIAQETGVTNSNQSIPDPNEIPKGLAVWREAVHRAQTSAQLAMCLYSLEASIAWDKSIMKAVSLSHVFNKMRARKYNSKLSNCQFCHSGDNEDKLLLCDGCDKGYHTYCFKPKMDNIPDGDWYCYECMNKATGERNCIVCGKKSSISGTKLILCELCPRAYHIDCIHPNLHKVPRGKWYCTRCISKKPQKKTVRKNHQKSTTNKDNNSELSDHPPSSPAPSHSSVTTNEDQMATNCNQSDASSNSSCMVNAGSPSTIITTTTTTSSTSSSTSSTPTTTQQQQINKKEQRISKKLLKELAPCKVILEDLECHDDAWPFLLPVNTKQFPTYKKIIKQPMDLSTIKKKLYDVSYKSREEFVCDVRQIFHNCEVFNEDDSPVGKAGHCMRQFFETRWNELCLSNS